MQFSDVTNKLGIIQACERYTNLGDASISGNAQLLLEFTAHANATLRRLWHPIFMAYGGWQYEDSNQTDLPSAYTDLVADQVSYSLPAEALTIRGVEIYTEDSNWVALKPLTAEQIREKQALGEFMNTPSNSRYYQLVGNTIRLFPATDYAQTDSIKVFFDRGSVAFASTDTTQKAGFASEYHDLVPIGASIEYLKVKTPSDPTLAVLRSEYAELEQRLIQFYSQRFQQLFPPRITVRDSLRDYL